MPISIEEVLADVPKEDLSELVASGILPADQMLDFIACYKSPLYFISTHVKIYDTVERNWIPFELWPAQERVLDKIVKSRKIIVLKSRQVGLTWLALSYILWEFIFKSPSFSLIMSKTDDDAMYLIGPERFKGMYERLPDHLSASDIIRSDMHNFAIKRYNGNSTVKAISTKRGDSYTGTCVLIDEADLIPDLRAALLSLEPVVNAGGKLIMISKSDRENPASLFKRTYRGSKTEKSEWVGDFISWDERPDRTLEWYEKQKETILETEGTLDTLYESYPKTDLEALSPPVGDKRININWLNQCYAEVDEVNPDFYIPETVLFEYPSPFKTYCIGVDCAEGLINSDWSVSQLIEVDSGRHIGIMVGKIPPDMHAMYTYRMSHLYNDAPVLVERNNHGHAFIVSYDGNLILGKDGRAGYYSTNQSKQFLYDDVVPIFRDKECTISDEETFNQLALISKNTLSAPAGTHDDRAIAFVLGQWARQFSPRVPSKAAGFTSFDSKDWDW